MPYADSDYERSWKMQTKGVMLYPATLARLYAAAPSMLAALKEIVAYDEGSNDPEDYGCEVLLRCKAAINKAEGRSE